MICQCILATYLFSITVCCSPFDMSTPAMMGVSQEMMMAPPYFENAHRARAKETLLSGDVNPGLGIALGASSLPPISDASELSCFQFDSTCRWRNVEGFFVDELDWFQGSGTLDKRRIQIATGTHVIPDGMYAIVATNTVQLPTAKAILASDQILCQLGPGQLRFKYWSSPDVRLRACTKKISKAFPDFDFCSSDIETGDPGPVYVTIPKESTTPFQLFVVAEHFVFHSTDLQGGFAIIDDIEYTAELCNKERRIEENSLDNFLLTTETPMHLVASFPVNQRTPTNEIGSSSVDSSNLQTSGVFSTTDPAHNSLLIRMTNSSLRLYNLTTEGFFPSTVENFGDGCDVLTCQFEMTQPCAKYASSSSWIVSSHPIGNPLTGIRGDASRLPFNESGSFAFISGPINFSRMTTPSFYLDRKAYFVFSYHKVDRKSIFRLYKKRIDAKDEDIMFEALNIGNDSRRWFRNGLLLDEGEYQYIAFEIRNLMDNNYIGVDEFMLVDAMRSPFCKI